MADLSLPAIRDQLAEDLRLADQLVAVARATPRPSEREHRGFLRLALALHGRLAQRAAALGRLVAEMEMAAALTRVGLLP